MPPAPVEDHFGHLARLLDLENRAEAQRAVERSRRLKPAEAEKSGTALVDLVIVDEDAGLGGRYLIRFAKRSRGELPWTRLGVGSPVLLSPMAGGDGPWRAVVSQKFSTTIEVALNYLPDELQEIERWRFDLANDEIALARQKTALERARLARGDRLAELRQVLLGEREARFSPGRDEPPLDAGLNEPQCAAVRFALSACDVALLHGPPGTGKTTTVVEIIRRAIRQGERVLACAGSNIAVDNMLERLVAGGENAVRLGHPARVLPELQRHTLDLLVEEHRDVALAHKLVKEALALFRKAGRYTRAKPQPGSRQATRQEAKTLLADARRLEDQAVEQILLRADVVCATTTGLDEGLLGNRQFDLVVLDEACQLTEPSAWIAIGRAKRLVLAGDHCQLPPTIVSDAAAAAGLGVSLFERLMNRAGERLSRRLTIQYRMHDSIMRFSSDEFYDGQLVAAGQVAAHRLCDMENVNCNLLTETPLEFIDTAGAGYDEEQEPDGESRLNPQEGELALRKVNALLQAGLSGGEVAVITPYAAQARWLRERINLPGLEVDSVDGFQGREKEAIVISLVRSNAAGEIGFLSDVRRMNVALTRARRKLVVIGDSATLASDPFYRRFLEYCEQQEAYHTVWEEAE
ncbi:MAG TPA: AAA domain-containing protein [Pirellulales bacterium]|nr:AAA domain-containing protein [Pirellulales bacterium]